MHGVTQRLEPTAPSEELDARTEPKSRPSPSSVTGRSLRYLFEGHPTGAETWEVAPGILWARVPLPFRLNHVNVWLLRERDGWTIVDTGTASGPAREMWQVLLGGVLSGAPIVRLIATHGHTDHVGLAGWLQQVSNGAPFHISLLEWLSAKLRYEDSIAPVSPTAIRFLEAHGCEAALAESFSDDRNRTHSYLEPLPPQIQRMKEGTRLVFGGREWRAMACGGHAPEHISLWCEADRILIAGDQILSKISPMIGVNPHEPDADPLTEYLTSLDRFRALPADALVLPSHGLPFHGLHERATELAEHHELRLGQLERLMETPQSAMRLAHGLFARAIADGHARHAFSETLAHAHHLVAHGRATRRERDGNIVFAAARG
jgi:glyoxylase-like metal-dependent hydrolase (beta-lactamase superfamily II)